MKMLTKAVVALLFCLPFSLAAQDFVGDWTMKMPADNGDMVDVHLSIKGDGSYTVDFGKDGNVEINGNYQNDGNQITVWDDGTGDGCPKGAKGVYNWAIEGDKMTMTRISDACTSRGGPEGKMVFTRG